MFLLKKITNNVFDNEDFVKFIEIMFIMYMLGVYIALNMKIFSY